MAHLPVCEISPIASLCPRLRHLPHPVLELRPTEMEALLFFFFLGKDGKLSWAHFGLDNNSTELDPPISVYELLCILGSSLI
jgi:hypothetical protein